MYCRNCGQKLADGDRFCSSCGTKAPVEDNIVTEGLGGIADIAPSVETTSPADEKPIFEPFDFKAFGFDFADLGLGTGAKKEEPAVESKPTPPTEEFDWNTGAFPTTNTTVKTEDVNFNWSLSSDEPAAPAAPVVEPEVFAAEEPKWTEADSQVAELEAELFGDIEAKADETRKQSEEIDKFFTFHKKNEEFQKILDREYEKVKSGNIITEEINAAEAVSEEKFVAREPEDPMEALFAEAGVIKGYEPKPIETDVLERIDAIEEEKRVREEAARLVEEEKAKREAEAAESAADIVVEEPATEEIILETETPAETAEAAEAAEPEVEEVQAFDVQEETPVEEITAETAETEEAPSVETLFEEITAQEEDVPEKTKQVDKAAILAEMALASEMVERDRAIAAAAEAAAAEAQETVAVPEFLGHQEEAPAKEEPVIEVAEIIAEETPAEETAAIEVAEIIEDATAKEPVSEEPVIEVADILEAAPVATVEEPALEAEEPAPELELDIFEQLEAQESPAAEIVLPKSQTIEDLFAETVTETVVETEEETVTEHTVILTEDSVAEILKTVEEDTTKDDTMVFTAHALGALLAEAEQEDPDAKEVVVSLEDLTSLEQQAAEGTLPAIAADAVEEDDEEYKGGKGRTFLKICLVILVILLAIEIAGVAIKIAAPTSGAANFIDNTLHQVFQLFGEESANPDNYNA